MFDEKYWRQELKDNPQWYLSLREDIEKLVLAAETEEEKEVKEQIYRLVAEALKAGDIYLGDSGEDWDEERGPIDTVVIHHTSREERSSEWDISAIDLLRLYAPRYWAEAGRPVVRGQPIWSGHFFDGHQTFCPYHWLVGGDGSVEHILEDGYIGWHGGNWDINCRSVAVALDGDFSEEDPSPQLLRVVAGIISANYPDVVPERIYGHREIYKDTVCPGGNFLGSEGWKEEILGTL